MKQPSAILETSLYCRDLNAARNFYTSVLGFEVHSEVEGRHIFFRCGSGMLLLFNPDATSTEVRDIKGQLIPVHGARGVGHIAFSCSYEEMDTWKAHLLKHGVSITSQITWPNGAKSIYFDDPAGNCLEFATSDLWRD